MGKRTEITLGSRIALAGEGLGLFQGKTAVAAITDLTTTVVIEDVGTGIDIRYGPPFDANPPSLDSVGAIVRTFQKKHEIVNNVRVSVNSNVPIGQGLASSGVLFCALAKCFDQHFDLRHTQEELVNIAWDAERLDQDVVCGKFDQYAILYKGALLQDFGQEPVRVQRFSLPADTRIVIGTTGMSTPYGEVGASIRNRFNAQDLLVFAYRDSMRSAVEEFMVVSEANDKRRMGELITFFHDAIRNQLQITNLAIDAMVKSALVNGAYASKTCGIRFKGGSMFALCTNETVAQVADAIAQLGAQTYIVSVAYP